MNQLHQNLYDLLGELDDLCQKHNIDYCLAGGSALGALRNHCFLPWDDDIDLYITRDNWNKLRALIESDENAFSEDRKMVYVENAPYHRNPIIRFVKTDTTVIYSAQSFSGRTCGLQVELFVLDPIPDDEEERRRFIELHKVYLELLSPYFIVNKNASIEEFTKHYRLYRKYYRKCRLLGYKRVMEGLERQLFHYDEKDCKDFCLRWGIRVLIHKKEFYQGKRTEILEARAFPVAYKLEHAMRVDYGDSWMYIPQGSGQLSHHPLIEDLNHPFETYTSLYLPRINRENMIRVYTKNKLNNMKAFVTRREIEACESKVRALIIEHQYAQLLADKQEELYELLEQRQYVNLNEIFADYYQVQSAIRKRNVFVNIGDANIYIAIMNYIQQGKYFSADGLLRVRENQDKALTEELEKCRNMIGVFKELSVARYDYKDVQKVKSLLSNCTDEYSQCLDVYRALLWVKEQEAENEAQYQEIKTIGESALELYPFDGELMAFIAKALLNLGEQGQAIEWYTRAVHNTRNGLVWHKAKQDIGLDRMLEE